MPELPEVETIRRALGPAVTGRRLVDTWSHPSEKFTPAYLAEGATVTDVTRRGKYLLVALAGPAATGPRELVVHLGMTGGLRLAPVDTVPSDPYVRALWRLDDGGGGSGTALEFRDVRRFGRLRVVPRGDHSTIPTLATIGPEPLTDDFTAPGLFSALRSSRRAVKTQLLSQRPVAGIGNIYADEALWLARVAPGRVRVTRDAAERLHEAIRTVLTEAIAHGGTTLRDYRDFAGATGTNQTRLACYGRAGQPCRRCGTALRSRVIDARTTTWCPSCQPSR